MVLGTGDEVYCGHWTVHLYCIYFIWDCIYALNVLFNPFWKKLLSEWLRVQATPRGDDFHHLITDNGLTKYKDLVVQHSSSQSLSSIGQWSSQSPAPGHVLQYLGGVQLPIIGIESSHNQEDLHDNYLLFIDIWYKPHIVSLSEIGTTGMEVPSNFELRQSQGQVIPAFPAVAGHILQSTESRGGEVHPSRDDVLVSIFHTTRSTVCIKIIIIDPRQKCVLQKIQKISFFTWFI